MQPESEAPENIQDLVPHDRIASYIQQLHQELVALSSLGRNSGNPLLREMLEELTAAIEELSIAAEELRVQNEELIASRLRIEEERQRYLDLFESAPDAYIVTDLNGIIREANRAAMLMLGASTRILIGKPLVVYVAPDERPGFRQRLLDLPQIGLVQEWDLNLRTRQGLSISGAVTVSTVRDLDGQAKSLRWIIRNITRRREEEAERYRLFIEGVKDYAVFMQDLDGVVTTWNPAAERILGYRADEIVGQSGDIIFTPEDRAAGEPERELRTAKTIGRAEDERWHLRKDGRRFWASGVMTALRGHDGELVSLVKVMRDLTARHEEEQRRSSEYRKHQQTAEVFQKAVLEPVPINAIPELEVAALYEAAWQEASIGGDFYDCYPLGDGCVALVLGDVTGKGVMAARRTAEVKFAARAFLHQEAGDPARVLFLLNNYLGERHRISEDDRDAFVSLAIAVIDPASGETTVALAAAEPPILLREDEETILRPGNLALGMFPDTEYTAETLHLGPTDCLLMVTDGITEARARDGRFLDRQGTITLARQALAMGTLEEAGQVLLDGARAFADGLLGDDACLILARRSK